ncbi:MAG: ligand-binding sensor domain-containing protein [Alteromonadaceae bacterium]
MTKYLLAFLLLLSGVLLNASHAREINALKSFPLDNPLSYQSVRTIAQDNQGFMWFGSQEGLQRYDGHTFLSFHHDASDKNSLSSGAISTLL